MAILIERDHRQTNFFRENTNRLLFFTWWRR